MDINIYHSSSAGNLYRVNDLLIDPGVRFKKVQECIDFKLSLYSGALISHSHADHSRAVEGLLWYGLDCYMGQDTAKDLDVSGHRVHVIEPRKQFSIGHYKILPFTLVHDVQNLGFLISKGDEKILYANDTNFIPYRFQGLTAIMIGVNYDKDILKRNILSGNLNVEAGKRIVKNHMSIQTALKFFKANDMSQIREIYLLHLSDGNSNSERFKREVEQIAGRPVYLAE